MKSLVFLAIVIAIQVGSSSAAERCWKKLDIGIIVNMKKSLGKEIDDKTVKPFLRNFIKRLKLKLEENKNLRLGVFSYGDDLKIRHHFTDDQSRSALLKAVNNYKFEPGYMQLSDALDECVEEKSCFPNHDDKSVEKVLLVLTDARGENTRSLARQVAEFQKRGYSFYAHNIDDMSEFEKLKEKLRVMVGEATYPNGNNIITKLVKMIEQKKCDDEQANIKPTTTPQPPKVVVHGDVIFVVDSSFSLTKTQWEQEINFTKDVASQLVIDGSAGARFAALTFDHRISPGFDWTDDALRTLHGLDSLEFNQGSATFTGAAMFEAIDVYFGRKYVPRSGTTAKIIVVVTDGVPSIPSYVDDAWRKAQEKGIHVFAVGVGPNMSSADGKPMKSMLDIVGGDSSRLFLVDEHSKLSEKITDLVAAMQKLPDA